MFHFKFIANEFLIVAIDFVCAHRHRVLCSVHIVTEFIPFTTNEFPSSSSSSPVLLVTEFIPFIVIVSVRAHHRHHVRLLVVNKFLLSSTCISFSLCLLSRPFSVCLPNRGVHHRVHHRLHLRVLTSYLWSQTKFDQLPLVTAMSSVNQVRHLPANEIISFLQADDSQCRAVSTALKSEVNTLIASDQAVCICSSPGSPGLRPLTLYDWQAFNALDTGANCPST